MNVLTVDNLTVRAGAGGPTIVENISFSLQAGEILGVVGESGSGKTTLGLAILGYGRDGAVITGGDVRIGDHSMVNASNTEISRLRGRAVAYVPQDPATALNPARRIGTQLREALKASRDGMNPNARIGSLLEEMDLPIDRGFLRRYPHELSGGQQQRVLLVLAFLCDPSVVVLDEPTTGLDVTTQARVLDIIRGTCRRHGAAAIFVSHDLDVVGTLAHRVLVLYGGRLSEVGMTHALFDRPQHRYTAALLRAAPSLTRVQQLVGIPGSAPRLSERNDGCAFAPRCDAADDLCAEQPGPTDVGSDHVMFCHHPVTSTVTVRDTIHAPQSMVTSTSTLTAQGLRAGYGNVEVLHGVDLEISRGECVALVGESGSGKTTLSQCLGGLHSPNAGVITLNGRALAGNARDRSLQDRLSLQYVFQNPFGSLNPRKSVRRIIEQPASALGMPPINAEDWIERVQLGRHVLGMRPSQLSGGERQRVAIARALTTNPEFLICDEITSALDVSIQASVIEVLQRLQRETGIGILFVTHDLPLVTAIANTVVVMQLGELVERGPVDSIFHEPTTDYTADLVKAVPRRDTALVPSSSS